MEKGFPYAGDGSETPRSHFDKYEVILDPQDDPQELSLIRRWLAVITISFSSLCVACASSAAAFTETGVANEFGVSREVTILAVSLYTLGLGMGPLLVGPLSEVYGRNIIYRVSFIGFFALTWPVAFAPNIAVYLVFRFITGLLGASFLSVAGGSVSDLFPDNAVATPMAVYTIFPFIGPELGPMFSGFINQNTNWRWTYYVFLIWSFVQTIALFAFVPETYKPVILKRKAQRLRKTTGNLNYYAPLERTNKNLVTAVAISCYRPFQLIFFDHMVLLLNLWSSIVLGVIYLAFQAFPIIFEDNHGFNMQCTGLTFSGIGLGMILALCSQPYWNAYRKLHGSIPPEEVLHIGQVGGILAPIGLFWLAFTTYPSVHWIVPILGSIPFGAGTYFIFTSVFTYLVVAYRPVAASALASNSVMRLGFAAVFPLFANAMYARLGTVGATALLAGLTTLMAPCPFVFYKIGRRLRNRSAFGTKDSEAVMQSQAPATPVVTSVAHT
ncbi:MFS general substrate transporter [Stereum hirsutum FP-91666 SS1]|uniref:MFS general substrate transporter n=1 Tax=Stereum hirsutum (strain FP-91666) TaxID=721885 RepID=UPI00044496D0|nr:MFS general substrate transporter [Stereum hirsutum FP-91666 SS1]EIM86273.1 MFS general substrate transporter [Stereum hirsutum FP-91666 SS1]